MVGINYGNTIDEDWVNTFGSEQLKLSFNQEYDCWRLYLNERVNQDFTGFSIHYINQVSPLGEIPLHYMEICKIYGNNFKIGSEGNYYYYLYTVIKYNNMSFYISKDISLNNVQLLLIWCKNLWMSFFK
jgi:hypothetical protein